MQMINSRTKAWSGGTNEITENNGFSVFVLNTFVKDQWTGTSTVAQ